MKKLRYGPVVVSAHAQDGLVIAVVQGVVTAPVATQVIAGAKDWAPARFAQVVSYEAATVELSADELFAAAALAPRSATPTALVVPPDRLAMFRRYSQMHLDHGVMKMAFSDLDSAHRWAAEQARIRESWGRWRRALAASP